VLSLPLLLRVVVEPRQLHRQRFQRIDHHRHPRRPRPVPCIELDLDHLSERLKEFREQYSSSMRREVVEFELCV